MKELFSLLEKAKNKIQTLNKKEKIFLAILGSLFFLSLIILIPFIRECLVFIVQKMIHRELRKPEKWIDFLFYLSLRTIFLCIVMPFIYFFVKQQKLNYYKVFCISIFMSFLFTNYLITKNNSFRGYWSDWNFADFTQYIQSYSNSNFYNTNYPPMAVSIYKFFNLLLPTNEECLPFAMNYCLSLFIFSTTIGLFIIFFLFIKKNTRIKLCVSAVLFITGPILFAYQRTNVILYALLFTIIFTCFYDSKNLIYREMAFLSLAVAANIKLYPAVFGAILLKEKKWTEAARCILYGCLLFIIPSIVNKSFISNMNDFISSSGNFTSSYAEMSQGTSISAYLWNLLKPHFNSFNEAKILLNIITIAIFIICLMFALISKKKWQSYLMLTYMCLLIPTPAYYYNRIFMIVPFIEFLNTYDKSIKERIVAGLFIPIFLYDFGALKCHPYSVWHIYTLFLLTIVFVCHEFVQAKKTSLKMENFL